jgi:hypothetical protein
VGDGDGTCDGDGDCDDDDDGDGDGDGMMTIPLVVLLRWWVECVPFLREQYLSHC